MSTDNWFIQLREFLIATNAKLVIPGLWTPIKEQINDICIMKSISTSGLQPAQIRLANNWRIFHGVNMLSDLTNPAGTHISKEYRTRPKGKPTDLQRKSKLKLPNQAEPGPEGHRFWMEGLRHSFGTDSSGKITVPLGNWLVSTEDSQSEWKEYFDPATNRLYRRIEDGYELYEPRYTRTTTSHYNTSHHPLLHNFL